MKKINFLTSDEEYSRLKGKCDSDKLSMSSVIRALLKEYTDGKIELRLRVENKKGAGI